MTTITEELKEEQISFLRSQFRTTSSIRPKLTKANTEILIQYFMKNYQRLTQKKFEEFLTQLNISFSKSNIHILKSRLGEVLKETQAQLADSRKRSFRELVSEPIRPLKRQKRSFLPVLLIDYDNHPKWAGQIVVRYANEHSLSSIFQSVTVAYRNNFQADIQNLPKLPELNYIPTITRSKDAADVNLIAEVFDQMYKSKDDQGLLDFVILSADGIFDELAALVVKRGHQARKVDPHDFLCVDDLVAFLFNTFETIDC
jgi:hypothetical protein